MIRSIAIFLLILGYFTPSSAESLVAARAIMGSSVINEADIRFVEKSIDGALSDPDLVVGREARVTIYAGRPIRAGDLRAPALIERNDIVRIRYRKGVLVIEADARALSRGAAGERISVMNLASRATLVGKVLENGYVEVTR